MRHSLEVCQAGIPDRSNLQFLGMLAASEWHSIKVGLGRHPIRNNKTFFNDPFQWAPALSTYAISARAGSVHKNGAAGYYFKNNFGKDISTRWRAPVTKECANPGPSWKQLSLLYAADTLAPCMFQNLCLWKAALVAALRKIPIPVSARAYFRRLKIGAEGSLPPLRGGGASNGPSELPRAISQNCFFMTTIADPQLQLACSTASSKPPQLFADACSFS